MKSKNKLRRERKKQKKNESNDDSRSSLSDTHSSGSNLFGDSENNGNAVVQEQRRSSAMLARKYEWITPNDPLYEMYQQVSSRFKRARDLDTENSYSEKGSKDEREPASTEPESTRSNQKKIHKVMKPSLVELKKTTRHPDLVEWFDADAPHPFFLVKLKTLPNVVQVPSNWRNRNEIPQFAPKQKYKLPHEISETRIAESRKGSRLDVDYERLHAAFFSPEAKRPLEHLLPYGEIIDLKLRRAFKPSSSNLAAQSRPTQISSRLREALGIREGDPLPWSKTVDLIGNAPGYESTTQLTYEHWGALS